MKIKGDIMKNDLRKELIKTRNSLSEEVILDYTSKIISNIKKTFDFNKLNCIGQYMSINKEVETKGFINELLHEGKRVVLPKVENKIDMDFYPIESLKDVFKGSFNVLEPISKNKMPKDKIDIIFIPGIAFSKEMNRLGYGAGFYDRYLKDYKGIKVGLCYSFQIKSFEVYPHDVSMDYVITENHVHQFHDKNSIQYQ